MPELAERSVLGEHCDAPSRERRFAWGFGPGLVSGASANDPTTVGSIAVVGATTGYAMAWLVVLLLPLLAIVQAIAASVAAASGMSLQQAIARSYGRSATLVCAVAVIAISLFTLGADVAAGAQALALLCGVPHYFLVVPLVAVACWVLATKSYLRVERILASLTLVFVCYVASAILARPNWGDVLRSIVFPHFELSSVFVVGALALLGTTLTSYVYFWESIEIAERGPARPGLRAARADAAIGMLLAGSSFLFILIATAATAGRHHVAIQTAADAAAALRPLAGGWARTLFGIGLFSSAAIAIPVIAATNGYVVAQTLGQPASLTLTPAQAPAFYRVIFLSLAFAGILAVLPVPMVPMLYWVSVAAGLATPITLILTMLVARNRETMHGRPIPATLACAGWAVTALVTLSALGVVLFAARSVLRL
ncbi:MAG TPA: divalent metal cation transporter [Candidatus Cybelea sp.]|jgi:Mn2+/Fe2+ NRAMP family transporter